MRICVYGAASDTIPEKYIVSATALGEEIARRGHSLVFGGGDAGVMGAAARGAKKHHGYVVGVVPTFFPDGVLFADCDDIHKPRTMRQRKQFMEDNSDAFVAAPGGIGTFDEFFEIYALRQLGRVRKPLVLFNAGGYYDPLLSFLDKAVSENFVAAESPRELLYITADPADALDYIESYTPPDHPVEVYKNFDPVK